MGQKLVGKVMDAHGIKGDLYCLIFSGDASWTSKLSGLELKLNGKSHEFEIQKLKEFKRGFIVTLKGFTDRNRAEEFKGAELWVDETLFTSKDGEGLYLNEILNFSLEDLKMGVVGKITNFSSNGIQDLLVVTSSQNEVFEVPFVKEFVTSLDFEKKLIQVDLPEGLLEINQDED